MKLIPLLYSTAMVQALLAGRKTQTRRILKVKGCQPFAPDTDWTLEDILRWTKDYHPYGQPGDVLWVRESFYEYGRWLYFDETEKEWHPLERAGTLYVADNEVRKVGGLELSMGYIWRKKPGIHMPFTAARIFLKVKSVRVERLQEISTQDAVAEGIEPLNMSATQLIQNGQMYRDYLHKAVPFSWQNGKSAKASFRSLWNSINGDLAWMQNPWVWVIEFERCEKPVLLSTANRQLSTI